MTTVLVCQQKTKEYFTKSKWFVFTWGDNFVFFLPSSAEFLIVDNNKNKKTNSSQDENDFLSWKFCDYLTIFLFFLFREIVSIDRNSSSLIFIVAEGKFSNLQ